MQVPFMDPVSLSVGMVPADDVSFGNAIFTTSRVSGG